MPPARHPQKLHNDALALWQDAYPDDAASLPYLLAERAALGHDVTAARRPARWIDTLHRYEEFTLTAGHTPRENTRDRSTLPAAERNLGEWARYQRRFEDQLCGYQSVRLDVSSAFVWDPHQDAWMNTFRACVAFTAQHQRLVFLNGDDPHEFALGRWLRRQLRHQHAGTADPARVAHIAGLLERASQPSM